MPPNAPPDEYGESSPGTRKQSDIFQQQQDFLDAVHVEQLKQQMEIMQSLGSRDFSASTVNDQDMDSASLALERAVAGVNRMVLPQMSAPPSIPIFTPPQWSAVSHGRRKSSPNVTSQLQPGINNPLSTSPFQPSPLNPASSLGSLLGSTSATSSPNMLATSDLSRESKESLKTSARQHAAKHSELSLAVQQAMGLHPMPNRVPSPGDHSSSDVGSATAESGHGKKRRKPLTPEERAEARKLVNREASKRARERKRAQEHNLEVMLEQLKNENDQMRGLISQLLVENGLAPAQFNGMEPKGSPESTSQ